MPKGRPAAKLTGRPKGSKTVFHHTDQSQSEYITVAYYGIDDLVILIAGVQQLERQTSAAPDLSPEQQALIQKCRGMAEALLGHALRYLAGHGWERRRRYEAIREAAAESGLVIDFYGWDKEEEPAQPGGVELTE
jgi:hypothetical protein